MTNNGLISVSAHDNAAGIYVDEHLDVCGRHQRQRADRGHGERQRRGRASTSRSISTFLGASPTAVRSSFSAHDRHGCRHLRLRVSDLLRGRQNSGLIGTILADVDAAVRHLRRRRLDLLRRDQQQRYPHHLGGHSRAYGIYRIKSRPSRVGITNSGPDQRHGVNERLRHLLVTVSDVQRRDQQQRHHHRPLAGTARRSGIYVSMHDLHRRDQQQRPDRGSQRPGGGRLRATASDLRPARSSADIVNSGTIIAEGGTSAYGIFAAEPPPSSGISSTAARSSPRATCDRRVRHRSSTTPAPSCGGITNSGLRQRDRARRHARSASTSAARPSPAGSPTAARACDIADQPKALRHLLRVAAADLLWAASRNTGHDRRPRAVTGFGIYYDACSTFAGGITNSGLIAGIGTALGRGFGIYLDPADLPRATSPTPARSSAWAGPAAPRSTARTVANSFTVFNGNGVTGGTILGGIVLSDTVADSVIVNQRPA